MTVVLYVLGVLAMVLGIGASIALHEIGHLAPAKRFGVRCSQYMIGFGPTLWSTRRGETEYGLKAIPLGGYVRMLGMFPPKAERRIGRRLGGAARTGRLGAMIDDAREQSLAEIGPGEEHRAFYGLSTPKKIVVMLGGPTMNLLIATLIFGGLVTFHGLPLPGDGVQIAGVAQCVRPVDGTPTSRQSPCTAADTPSPAAAAGLRPGDVFVSIAGERIGSPADVARLVRGRAGVATPVVVDRDGRHVDLTITPIANPVPTLDANGNPVRDAGGDLVTTTAGFIGTSSTVPVRVYDSLADVPAYVWRTVELTGRVVLTLPQRLVDVAEAAFGPAQRDPEGPMSVVGVGRVAGEVTSGSMTTHTGETATADVGTRILMLWTLLGGLNIALFVFNLIPLLPLDGGHVAGALWEGMRRSIARVTGRPDPGHVDVARMLPVSYAVSIVFIAMSVLLIYADIVKPVRP